ncbi:unnamed protein product [Parnassius mnemosyne]|uniref:tRNA-specific adenosine deaminase 1 n=1 Tax=Parnassius mnemosyne TaxID=213953 RepID=A0AAV1LXB4_9NEOP
MTEFTKEFVDKISLSCIQLYNTLPKIGKAIEGEWTVLSCIIQFDRVTKKYEVVSLGTGSKCIGACKMSPEGDIVHDSHAEVFARRGFMLYLYDNIEKAIVVKQDQESIFQKEKDRFKLRDNLEFIFYSSQLPCGDASIMPKTNEDDHGDVVCSLKREAEGNNCDVESKKIKLETQDIHRTGAKCLPQNEQDPKEPGANYHLLGRVRTKPGRGDRTLSVSCSDKMARWIHVGIQGALLDMLLMEPIYIKHFIFGSGAPYSQESLTRALLKRNLEDNEDFTIPFKPFIYNSTAIFHLMKSERRSKPAPGSIVIVNCGIIEVGVHGKRLGVTKRRAHIKNSLCISKYNMYRRFVELLQKDQNLKERLVGEDDVTTIPYNEMKKKSQRYYENWYRVRDSFFKSWTIKPDMWNFCIKPNT